VQQAVFQTPGPHAKVRPGVPQPGHATDGKEVQHLGRQHDARQHAAVEHGHASQQPGRHRDEQSWHVPQAHQGAQQVAQGNVLRPADLQQVVHQGDAVQAGRQGLHQIIHVDRLQDYLALTRHRKKQGVGAQ